MEITPICLEWLRTAPALPLSSGFSVGKLKITASRGSNPPKQDSQVSEINLKWKKITILTLGKITKLHK